MSEVEMLLNILPLLLSVPSAFNGGGVGCTKADVDGFS